MNLEELKKILSYKEIENKRMFVPNEIFEDFARIPGQVSNRAFCYSFYYLIMYLYRFTKYGNARYSVGDLKKILGYSENNKTVDKFIKKKGILEEMGYLSHSTNYPTTWKFDEDEGVPEFIYYEDFINNNTKEEMIHFRNEMGLFLSRRNKKIYVPVKGLYRSITSLKNNEKDGVFFCINDTTRIEVEAFLFCMYKDDLGVEEFWLYSYIRYMSEHYGKKWTISQDDMCKVVGMSKPTLNRRLYNLEKFNMINNDHKPYVIDLPGNVRVEGCSYNTNERYLFEVEEQKVEKRIFLSYSHWCDENNVNPETGEKNPIDITGDPFINDPFPEDDDLSWIQS